MFKEKYRHSRYPSHRPQLERTFSDPDMKPFDLNSNQTYFISLL